MLQQRETVEVIIPIYNEEQCISDLMKRLFAVRDKMNSVDMSFLFVNDGSRDNSLSILRRYAQQDPSVKIINFSRNFGHQIAVSAGLDAAQADYVAIIDADLQDPPELIENMYQKAKEGFDIVYGRRLSRKGESLFKKVTAKLFYMFINKMCNIELPIDTGDFRLIRRPVLNVLQQMREKHRFIRGMVPWAGFLSAPLFYNRDQRYAGTTKYPTRKMLRFALDAIFSFSNTPLRIATYSGLGIVGLGIIGMLLILYFRFFTNIYVPGITAVVMTVIILGGFQIIMLGIIGEYIGRIFEEIKNRPLYVIQEMINFKEQKVKE